MAPENIFSSLRSDPAVNTAFRNDSNVGQLYLFKLHHERLLEAARALQWDKTTEFLAHCDYKSLAEKVESGIKSYLQPSSNAEAVSAELNKNLPFRIRISLDKSAVFKVEVWPAIPIPATQLVPRFSGDPLVEWTVYLDSISTKPSILTSFKTSSREVYEEARSRVGIASLAAAEEVLLYNPEGEVMEASICSVYFRRDGAWVTPSSDSGGQLGVSRRTALREGVCVERVVKVSSLTNGEIVWLSNGVRGFFPARYSTKHPTAQE